MAYPMFDDAAPRDSEATRSSAVTIGGARLRVEAHPASTHFAISPRRHPAFTFVLRGSFADDYRHDQRLCRTNSILFTPAALGGRRSVGSEGTKYLFVELPASLEASREAPQALFRRISVFEGGELAVLAQRVVGELRVSDEQSPLAIRGLLYELLSRAARLVEAQSGRHGPACLQRAERLLRERFQGSIRLSDVAAEIGVHQVYLARVFRRHRHCSVGEYLRRLRIEWAIDRLVSGDRPLADIALQAGFADQSHFTRVFRALTGTTPARYRSEQRAASGGRDPSGISVG